MIVILKICKNRIEKNFWRMKYSKFSETDLIYSRRIFHLLTLSLSYKIYQSSNSLKWQRLCVCISMFFWKIKITFWTRCYGSYHRLFHRCVETGRCNFHSCIFFFDCRRWNEQDVVEWHATQVHCTKKVLPEMEPT